MSDQKKANEQKKRQLFGTDGIRGVANSDIMSAEMAMRVGQAVGVAFRGVGSARNNRVVIGKDTRLSGYMIETALSSGLLSTGIDVLLVSSLPTPGIAFISSSMRARAGVVISASHNPFTDNGIKLFDENGFKLPDEVELEIERLVLNPDELRDQVASPEKIGKLYRITDAVGRYVVSLKSSFPRGMTLSGLRIVVDCANGATYKVAPEVLFELGAEIITIGNSPTGTNINRGVGSTHPEAMALQVLQHGADLGVAFDGDGDRVIFVDHEGKLVDGDAIMALVGVEMLKQNRLAGNTVVGTIMSNLGLELALRKHGGQLVRTAVGDRYVMERMLADGYVIGGEQSGHMIFLEHSTTGDGILAALQVLALMQQSGKSLKELAAVMQPVPQVSQAVTTTSKPPLEQMPGVQAAIKSAESSLGVEGRVVMRYSGTEPKVRIMVEGTDENSIKQHCAAIAAEFETEIANMDRT